MNVDEAIARAKSDIVQASDALRDAKTALRELIAERYDKSQDRRPTEQCAYEECQQQLIEACALALEQAKARLKKLRKSTGV